MNRIILCCALAFSLISNAQNNLDLSYYFQESNLNPDIPTPESVIGHPVGKWHITHDKLVQYMYALAEASDRITIENRGKTFEDRPLVLLTITSTENHANIDDIQKEHMALTEAGAENVDLNNAPIVVYQGFSIHGNEPSGSNAALVAAYYLAAVNSEEVKQLLSDVVILFDPSFNPDGLQRFAYWANTNKNKNLTSDPNDREYDEVWPRGRTNHYWFDMNRDWLPVQLPESRARINTFHKWMPNILTDHHEMGSNASFFFQPGIPSRTHPLTPDLNQSLTKEIAKFHAKALDNIGSLYYSEESFDDYYYGKGSTFPDINGAVGILFEQASSRGHLQETSNGLLSFPFTIRNQFTTALSTLKAAQSLRENLLNYQRDFFAHMRNNKVKQAIVFGDAKDAAKTYHLAEILSRHKIEFYELKEDITLKGKNYKKGYSFVVPKQQKNSKLLQAMFEKRTTFKDSLFYDVSAWTFPLAFNIDYNENASMSNAGSPVTDLKLPEGKALNKSNYAYLVEWHEYYSPKFAFELQSHGIRIKGALKQFTAGGIEYDYGTLMIPVQNQKYDDSELFNRINIAAKNAHLTVTSVNTGLNQGIDLGSNNFRTLKTPEIALVVGNGVSSYDAGEIWHLLDQRFNIPIAKLDTEDLGRLDLSRYNTIILPSAGGLSESVTNNLKSWIENGGTLIGYRNTISWLNSKEIIKVEIKKSSLIANDVSFEDRQNFRGAQNIGGAIFNAKIDRSHPINFGYKNDELALFRNTSIFMEPEKQSYNNPIQYTNKPLLSGYISEEKLDSLKSTVPFKTKRLKRGKVLLFTDNTNFRGFWYGTNKLLMNAIFFRNEM
ncbi:M14 family metallopeptidase [Urechidicola sp. KH5]